MEQRKRQQRLEALETDISSLEERLALITRQLENPGGDATRIQRLGKEYVQLQQELEKKMEDWAAITEAQV